LLLASIGREGQNLVFVRPKEPLDEKDYVLPESVDPSYFRRKDNLARELFLDSVKVAPSTAQLISEIEIEDKAANDFIHQRLLRSKHTEGTEYRLVYHNFRDQETDSIKLKADALVLIHKGSDQAHYVLVHKWKGSALSKLPLETVVEEHPARVVFSTEKVKYSGKLYADIYTKSPRRDIPLKELAERWPFPLPKLETFVDLRKPAASLREKWQIYRRALKQDNIFGLTALGSLFQSAGKGLAEGALLYPMLGMAQDEMKVAATLGFMGKAYLAVYLWANSRSASKVEHLEAKERLGEVLDKQFPLWDMGAQYKTTDNLLNTYTKLSLAYLATQTIFFTLFPPIFKTVLAGLAPALAAGVFVAGYLGAEYWNARNDAFDNRNSFKIAENRLRYNPKLPQYEKNFWTVSAFQDNLGLAINQLSFWSGFGLFTLVSLLAPAYLPAAGVGLGALSLLLCLGRFILPLFGREERTRLKIESTEYLRYGRSLKVSNNISIRLGNNPKVKIIEQEDRGRIVIPDFNEGGVKLRVRQLESITVKRSWLRRILLFAFTQKYSVVVRTKDPTDPAVIFTIYGRHSLTPEEIREKYIEVID